MLCFRSKFKLCCARVTSTGRCRMANVQHKNVTRIRASLLHLQYDLAFTTPALPCTQAAPWLAKRNQLVECLKAPPIIRLANPELPCTRWYPYS